MISDKILPCFYLVDVEGVAVQSIIPGDYGIDKIAFGANDFQSDMHAIAATEKVLLALKQPGTSTEKLEVNPEFFPSKVDNRTLEQLNAIRDAQDMADEISERIDSPHQIAIPITYTFDPIGDYVVCRKMVSGNNFMIRCRVVANLNYYAMAKSQEQVEKLSMPPVTTNNFTTH